MKKLLDTVALWAMVVGYFGIIAVLAAVAQALPDDDRGLAWWLAGLIVITGLGWRHIALTEQDEPLTGNAETYSLIAIGALAGALVFGLVAG